MNQDFYKSAENLEKATAPGDKIDASLDAETASLREGWLALGKLLETAEAETQGPPVLHYSNIEDSPRRRWQFGLKQMVVLAALAASLLIAAAAGLSLLRNDKEIIKQTTEAEIARHDAKLQESIVNNGLDWDDSLDTEIAAAGSEMQRIQTDWYASTDSAAAIYYRLNAIQQDLNENTL